MSLINIPFAIISNGELSLNGEHRGGNMLVCSLVEIGFISLCILVSVNKKNKRHIRPDMLMKMTVRIRKQRTQMDLHSTTEKTNV
jgi:hypothetical protein